MMTLTQKDICRETTAVFSHNRRPGVRGCLVCDQPFHSWHIVLNRVCPACHRQWERNVREEK